MLNTCFAIIIISIIIIAICNGNGAKCDAQNSVFTAFSRT